MLNASQTRATVAATVAVGSVAVKSGTGDADLFARELGSRLVEAGDAMTAALEKLTAIFPGTTVSGKTPSGSSTIQEYRLQISGSASINIGPDMLGQMAEDEEMFAKVTEMLSRVFAAGKEQSLVGTGGSNVGRNVTVQGTNVRYVEVRRAANGTQLSASALTMKKDELLSDALDRLFSPSGQTSSRTRGFEGLLSGAASWRFESFVSAQSVGRITGNGSDTVNGLTQTLMASQSFSASIEVIVERWSASGGTGQDLLAYIQSMDLSDPLVLDLGGSGIELSSAEDGVYFDIRGDGTPVRTAFIRGDTAFLYLDANSNGIVDDAGELFGDQGGFANGFAKLSQYDDNGDGAIDERDAIYSQLRLWRDLDGDGVCREGETMSLSEAGVASLSLRHDNQMSLDVTGNVIGERSLYTKKDGTTGLMADVWLRNGV